MIAHDEPSVAVGTEDCVSAGINSMSSYSHSANTSGENVHDTAMKHFAWISHSTPQFAVDAANVHILSEPSDYYETLKVCLFLTA